MTTALIDGDLVAYISAASCTEDDGQHIALLRVEDRMRKILTHTNCSSYKVFVSGGSNLDMNSILSIRLTALLMIQYIERHVISSFLMNGKEKKQMDTKQTML